jgi:hypothetical protein
MAGNVPSLTTHRERGSCEGIRLPALAAARVLRGCAGEDRRMRLRGDEYRDE